jgi:hypothetical protein
MILLIVKYYKPNNKSTKTIVMLGKTNTCSPELQVFVFVKIIAKKCILRQTA